MLSLSTAWVISPEWLKAICREGKIRLLQNPDLNSTFDILFWLFNAVILKFEDGQFIVSQIDAWVFYFSFSLVIF